MSAAIADTLDAAADLLERDGWCCGVYQDLTGAHCAIGALSVVAPSGGFAASRTLREHVGKRVTVWNDSPERTAAEVIAAFRACAAKQRES